MAPYVRGDVVWHPAPFRDGGAPKSSWASPWYVLTLKHATITDRLGRLTVETVDEVATAVARLIGIDTS